MMKPQRETTYNRIREAILQGELKPGERLIENKLSERFHIGRTPLREALFLLQSEGLIEYSPHKGASVPTLTFQELEEIYDIISILEGHATEKATKYIKLADKKKLNLIQNDLETAGETKDYNLWIEKNTLFHSYFGKISKNVYLPKITKSLRDRIYKYRYFSVILPGHIEHYLKEHRIILDAVFSGQEEKAGKAMRSHVQIVKEVLLEFLRKSPGF